ncbi:MAG: DUF459 domain-containing protein [Myxococcaceae bacterium]|nr:DUF459 domain-containing protein [Myxococcaceae bacterium]MCI0673233.1 DUF459 domain-containing protein [Myxococcaceae bacterium]
MHDSPVPGRARSAAQKALALAWLLVTFALPASAQPPGDASPRSRVLLIGDSHIVSGLGPPLERLLGKGGVEVVGRRGKSSSGLARPDFFDWHAEARRLIATHHPDVVVLMMGGNDGQALVGHGLKEPVRWTTPEWTQEYRRRMRALLEMLTADGRQVVWLELPHVTLPHLERKLVRIRQLQREVLTSVVNAHYVETLGLFHASDGTPLLDIPGTRGRPAPLRMEDGIHLTLSGGRYLAKHLASVLLWHLETVRPDAQFSARSGPAAGAARSGTPLAPSGRVLPNASSP